MKVFFPRNIDWWRLNIWFQVWPIRVTLVQLLIVASWVAMALGIRNAMVKNWFNKLMAGIFVSPIIMLFLFIAFFKLSELSLIPFIAKFIQTNILDETIKYQINTTPIDQKDIAIANAKYEDNKKSKIEEKNINQDEYKKLQDKNILSQERLDDTLNSDQ